MKIFYKVFLIILSVFTGINLYAMQWDLGVFHEDNTAFLLSIGAGVVGILLILIMDSLSRLSKSAQKN